mmetsp:Transcript_7202/g.14426  ORF Transcript_7202/g.14426 Transcript_7202/m.14426 type:complete len:712 (+) Transcript_7202:163-2298(+)
MAKGKDKGKKPKHDDDADEGGDYNDAGGDWGMGYEEPRVEWIAPAEQLQLSAEELDTPAEPIVLRNKNPNVPTNSQKYDYSRSQFVEEPPLQYQELMVHLDMRGSRLHKESQIAQTQQAWEREALDKRREQERKAAEDDEEDTNAGLASPTAVAAAAVGGIPGVDGDIITQDPIAQNTPSQSQAPAKEITKNQFNYSDRAAQTFNNPKKNRGVSTKPPELRHYQDSVTQWEIYDLYVSKFLENIKDQEIMNAAAKKKKKKNGRSMTSSSISEYDTVEGGIGEDKAKSSKESDLVHGEDMSKSLKILERMVNQNAELEIYEDYKYWEDQSDQFRDGEGSLLPLWRFTHDRVKRKQVTAVCWNPALPDLFAVGYGSYDFMRQGSGMVCCYSLKNTSAPEYSFTTESGVMSVDFHPQSARCALLSVGCYDGTVMVFDVRSKLNKPIYISTIKTGKHSDPVYGVKWTEEEVAKEPSFYSISSDGQVANWSMSKSSLKMEPMMQLKLMLNDKDEADEDATLSGLAGGCCFAFNTKSEHLFLVGTEEGMIAKCSKSYSGQYLQTYEGHHMAVYAVAWNPFHPRVFLSCSADWTVKLWDHNLPHPIMSFDLGNPVGEVAWAPYSSTVFAAVTSDGKVHVFDLSENKHEPLCEQKVVKRAKLTHLAFSTVAPILLVGDDRGGVNSLKLSPNLRKPVPDEEQLPRMDRLLAAADTSQTFQ